MCTRFEQISQKKINNKQMKRCSKSLVMYNMLIKSKLRYSSMLYPYILNWKYHDLVRLYNNYSSQISLTEMWSCILSLQKWPLVSHIVNIPTIRSGNSIPRFSLKKKWTGPHKTWYSNVDGSFIQNSQTIETNWKPATCK